MVHPGIRAVLFDLDGVLGDSEPCHVRAWQEVLPRYGVRPDDGWYRDGIGVSDEDLVASARGRYRPGLPVAEVLREKQAAYLQVLEGCLKPYPGVRAAILAAGPLPRGVATSSSRAEAGLMLRILGLADLFPVVVTASDVARPKPAPDLYLLAASRLGLPAGDCAAIEDSPAGIESARAAGCLVLGVAHNLPAAALGRAHRVFAGTAEAVRWLRQAASGAPPG